MSTASKRPAEAVGSLAAAATAAAALLGADATVVAVVGTSAGVLPAVVTYLVSHGGARGVMRALWRGQPRA